MKFWASCSALALALLVVSSGVALKGCWGGGQSCNESLDCLIFCECPGVGVGVTVGPYPCRMGTCGEQQEGTCGELLQLARRRHYPNVRRISRKSSKRHRAQRQSSDSVERATAPSAHVDRNIRLIVSS